MADTLAFDSMGRLAAQIWQGAVSLEAVVEERLRCADLCAVNLPTAWGARRADLSWAR